MTRNLLPLYLRRRRLEFRTVCSSRINSAATATATSPLTFSNAQPSASHNGSKFLESFKEEFQIGQSLVTYETGKIARFCNGSVVIGLEETKVLSTVVSSKGDAVKDFLPLTVDYQEKQFAQGMILGTFMRREGAPKERELLCGRIIDRPIRPPFPPGFYHEVQVMASVLSSDGRYDPDVMAANATSAALLLSDIPWRGPIGMIRIGRIDGKFIVNPTMDEAVKFIEPQIRLTAKAGKAKKEYSLSLVSEKTLEKFERGEALENITREVKKTLEEEVDEESIKVLPKAVDTVRKQIVRERIISDGLRLDGRRLDGQCIVNLVIYLSYMDHLSSRAETLKSVLCTVTLGAPGDAQHLDSLVGPVTKRFMLHYSFPPYSINEVGKRLGLNRREVGHGTLAEKALLAVLPSEKDFPYTVRITSEVMASDGSTSMETVCGASMALMDAGIPIKEHVAGISVGLVTAVDPLTGEIKDYRILTDILGLEDHLGDIDFKVAGTREGITAIQLDMKPAGIPLDIICECLEPACKGRRTILDHMEREISTPRSKEDRSCPLLETLHYSNDSLRRLIGPIGVTKKVIEEQTGARLFVGDKTLTILAKNQSILQNVLDKIEVLVGREIEIGGVYKGVVTSIKEYGVFVEFNGGQQGLLHISEISHEPVSRVTDVISIGQQLSLMCIGQDLHGNIKLSLKAMTSSVRKENKMNEGRTAPVGLPSDFASDQDPYSTHVSFSKNTKNNNEVYEAAQSKPSIVIRSAAECDEEERPSLSKKKVKTGVINPKTLKIGMKVDAKINEVHEATRSKPSIVIRSAAECDEEERPSLSKKKVENGVVNPQALKIDMKLAAKINEVHEATRSKPSIVIRSAADCDEKERSSLLKKKVKSVVVNPKTLKIGMKLDATVYQIRARGLVLDLGGGIRGMLRFEENSKKDFNVGEEIRVECSSFSGKGIPVMILKDN
ncbi:unnamed protein product [Rhodiola kirilowii]